MKAEIGQKLSGRRGRGLPWDKKSPGGKPGFEVRQYGGKGGPIKPSVQLRGAVRGVAPRGQVPPATSYPPQRRYRIWSVQKRSRRCSALLSTPNSSALMPPTCSTVRTC